MPRRRSSPATPGWPARRLGVAVLATYPLTWFFRVHGVAHAMLIACVLLVLGWNSSTSAVEAAVDRISLENHRLAKRAKDIGSAAVLISLVNVGLVWGLILLD